MKKTINVNIGGMVFHLDDDAYEKCGKYLDVLKIKFRNTEGGDEIVGDIELRIAELFKERLGGVREVVTLDDVNEMVAVMGEPDSFTDIDPDHVHTNTDAQEPQTVSKRLFRNPEGRILGGVCTGFAAYFNLDPWLVRILMIILVLFGGVSFLLYFVFWIAMPEAVTSSDKLLMHGKAVNVNNIEETVKREWNETKSSIKKNTNQLRGSAFVSGLGKFLRVSFGLFLIFSCTISMAIFLWAMLGKGSTIHDVSPSGHETHLSIREGSSLIFDNFSERLIAYTSSWLLVVIPCVLFTYLGIRLILQFKHRMRYVMLSGFLLWLIGLVLAIYSGVNIAEKFKMEASTHNTEHLPLPDSALVRVSVVKPEHIKGYNLQGISIQGVDFDIVKSTTDTVPTLEIEKISHGVDKEAAYHLAEKMNYYYRADNADIQLASYFMIDKGEKFRGQHVNIVLNLPVGYRVYLEKGTDDVINNIKNVQRVWDHDMPEHTWIMTKEGLSCEDCPKDIMNLEQNDSLHTGNDDEVNIHIKNGEVDIK